MGSDVDAFVKRFKTAARTVEASQKATMTEATNVAKAIITASRNRGAPSGRLRNVGKNGAALGVTSRVIGTGAETSGRVKATGPWPILDNPTKGHTIGAGKGRKKAKSGIGPSLPGKRAGGVLYFAAGPRDHQFATGPIHHPGTHGKHTFILGREAAVKPVVEVLQKSNVKVVRSLF